jgi:transcriptional regulator with XRE-family HTH domain
MRGKDQQLAARQRLAPNHPVALRVATGDPWLRAWRLQALVRFDQLAPKTGISIARLFDIERGEAITHEELRAVARAIGADPADLIASLPDPALLIA